MLAQSSQQETNMSRESLLEQENRTLHAQQLQQTETIRWLESRVDELEQQLRAAGGEEEGGHTMKPNQQLQLLQSLSRQVEGLRVETQTLRDQRTRLLHMVQTLDTLLTKQNCSTSKPAEWTDHDLSRLKERARLSDAKLCLRDYQRGNRTSISVNSCGRNSVNTSSDMSKVTTGDNKATCESPGFELTLGPPVKIQGENVISCENHEESVNPRIMEITTKPRVLQEEVISINDEPNNKDNSAPHCQSLNNKERKQRAACSFCGKVFRRLAHCVRHERIHTGDKPYKCGNCGKRFASKDDCKKHELIHSDDRPHVCKVCGKGFCRLVNCVKHERIHTGDKPHQCGVCEKRFAWKGNCKNHELTHSSDRPHVCKVCGKGFRRPAHCVRHERTHTGDKPYQCGVCGKRFIRKLQCKRHELVHSGDRPHACKVCGKGFTSKEACNRHELIHSGDRPHQCKVCLKAFTFKGDCKRHHARIHSSEEFKYHCSFCGKGFHVYSDQIRHERTHTKEKYYACRSCGKKFIDIRGRNRHENVHHS